MASVYEREFVFTHKDFEYIRDLVGDRTGIVLSDHKVDMVYGRLARRLRQLNIPSFKEYLSVLEDNNDSGELIEFTNALTTNLTSFFREPHHFDFLLKRGIPELLKRRPNKRLRIWSAGCSTGEEPYSLAIMLKEIVPASIEIEIIASDLSLKSLMTAKEGYYPDTRVGDVPEKYLNKYFEKVSGGYRVADPVKKLITFDYHNLKFDSGHQALDIIFCRNVIIYFDETAQKAVIEKFWNALDWDSYLFIGHSESLFGMDTRFEFVKTDWATLYRKSKK